MANGTYDVTNAIRTIKGVSLALDNVEVKGRTNMDILMGSMQALDRSIASIEAAFKELTKAVEQPEIKSEAEEEPAK